MTKTGDFRAAYGPWALVVGASAGLGAAFVRELAARGLSVVAVARSRERLEELRAEAGADGRGELLPVALDLLEEGALERLYEATARIEVGLLVYNLGFPNAGAFLARPLPSHRALIALNLLYPLDLVRRFAERMRARGRGGILLLSSLTSLAGSPETALYGASKAFAMTLAEGIGYELAGAGIDVGACAAGVLEPDHGEPPLPFAARLLAMAPRRVARIALDGLPRGGVMIPGLRNRLIALVIGRLLPRGAATRLMALTVRMLEIERRQRSQAIR